MVVTPHLYTSDLDWMLLARHLQSAGVVASPRLTNCSGEVTGGVTRPGLALSDHWALIICHQIPDIALMVL